MLSTTELEKQTQNYWDISFAWNGRSPKPPSVGDAITKLNEVSYNLGPHRLVKKCSSRLNNEIVRGAAGPKKKTVTSKTITQHLLQLKDSTNV